MAWNEKEKQAPAASFCRIQTQNKHTCSRSETCRYGFGLCDVYVCTLHVCEHSSRSNIYHLYARVTTKHTHTRNARLYKRLQKVFKEDAKSNKKYTLKICDGACSRTLCIHVWQRWDSGIRQPMSHAWRDCLFISFRWCAAAMTAASYVPRWVN